MERIIQGSKKSNLKKLINGVFGEKLKLFHAISLLIRRIDEIINREYVKINNVEDTINNISIKIKFSDVNA